MGMIAAKQNDFIPAVDTHIVMVPTPGGPVPTPLPHPFMGKLDGALINSVKIQGKAAAVKGSTATNSPAHIPTPPGTSFQKPPADKGMVFMGSGTVKIGGKAAARMADPAKTCNDPSDVPVGQVVATGTVFIG